jgi:hypothetical protein
LEELLPKDNENILPFVDDGPITPTEPQGFKLEEMVRCEECLRANPPTKVNCIYCGAQLPVTERTIKLQRPTLRPLQKGELGYNCILVGFHTQLGDDEAAEVSSLLKLSVDDLKRIAKAGRMPLARTPSHEEASLVGRRLAELGIETMVVSDKELEVGEPFRIRAAEIDSQRVVLHQSSEAEGIRYEWESLALVVLGRLRSKRVEVRERKGGRSEGEIVDASELFSDELVMDIYWRNSDRNCRIVAGSFDFSCV